MPRRCARPARPRTSSVRPLDSVWHPFKRPGYGPSEVVNSLPLSANHGFRRVR